MIAKSYAFHILRVGLAITFIWIGVLILRSPEAWGGFIQPWVVDLLPFSVRETMIGTAIFDIAVGAFLLVDVFTWFAAIFAAIHLAIVLLVSGIDVITVRDIGLLAASLSLAVAIWPKNLRLV